MARGCLRRTCLSGPMRMATFAIRFAPPPPSFSACFRTNLVLSALIPPTNRNAHQGLIQEANGYTSAQGFKLDRATAGIRLFAVDLAKSLKPLTPIEGQLDSAHDELRDIWRKVIKLVKMGQDIPLRRVSHSSVCRKHKRCTTSILVRIAWTPDLNPKICST